MPGIGGVVVGGKGGSGGGGGTGRPLDEAPVDEEVDAPDEEELVDEPVDEAVDDAVAGGVAAVDDDACEVAAAAGA